MNRFTVFAVLFPILALIVFVAPETIQNGAIPAYFWGSMTFVYVPGMPFAMIAAGVDHLMSNHPLGARLFMTTATTGIVTAAFISWLWGSVAVGLPLMMAFLDGAIPAAACSLIAHFVRGRL